MLPDNVVPENVLNVSGKLFDPPIITFLAGLLLGGYMTGGLKITDSFGAVLFLIVVGVGAFFMLM